MSGKALYVLNILMSNSAMSWIVRNGDIKTADLFEIALLRPTRS